MKKFIFLLLIIFSSVVCSEEVKLICNIKLVKKDDGKTVTNYYHEIFEISDDGYNKFIRSRSNKFSSISTLNRIDQITDKSDSTMWDILSESKNKNGKLQDSTHIRIDRNLGDIWYDRLWTIGGITTETGTGTCKNVDVSKIRI